MSAVELLDPPFDVDPPADAPAPTSAEVAKVVLRDAALADLNAVNAGIAALREAYGSKSYEVATTAGLELAKAARAAIRAPRYKIEHIRKARKAELLAIGKDVDAEAKRITDELLAIEAPIDTQIKAQEDAKEAERARREQEARDAQNAIDARIAEIRDRVLLAANKPASEIATYIEWADNAEITSEHFGEQTGRALQTRAETRAKLVEMHAAALQAEAAQREVIAERARQAKERAARKQFEEIRNMVLTAATADASTIEGLLADLDESTFDEAEFGALVGEGEELKASTAATLTVMLGRARDAEQRQRDADDAQARLVEQQQAQQRQQEAIDKQAREQKAQADKVEADRVERAAAVQSRIDTIVAMGADQPDMKADDLAFDIWTLEQLAFTSEKFDGRIDEAEAARDASLAALRPMHAAAVEREAAAAARELQAQQARDALKARLLADTRKRDAAPALYAALVRLRAVAVWDEDTDRTEFDAAAAEADAAIALATA